MAKNRETKPITTPTEPKPFKGGAAASFIPAARKLIPILVFLPLIIFAITMLLDLPNVTFWHTVTINGQTQWRYNWLAYFKNIDDAGQVLKNTFSSITLNFDQVVETQIPPNLDQSDNIIQILLTISRIAIAIANIAIFILNLLSTLLNLFTAILTVVCGLIMIFIAVLGFNTEQIWIFKAFFEFYKILGNIRIPQIPYIQMI